MRSAVQWYFPLWSKRVFSCQTHCHKNSATRKRIDLKRHFAELFALVSFPTFNWILNFYFLLEMTIHRKKVSVKMNRSETVAFCDRLRVWPETSNCSHQSVKLSPNLVTLMFKPRNQFPAKSLSRFVRSLLDRHDQQQPWSQSRFRLKQVEM